MQDERLCRRRCNRQPPPAGIPNFQSTERTADLHFVNLSTEQIFFPLSQNFLDINLISFTIISNSEEAVSSRNACSALRCVLADGWLRLEVLPFRPWIRLRSLISTLFGTSGNSDSRSESRKKWICNSYTGVMIPSQVQIPESDS